MTRFGPMRSSSMPPTTAPSAETTFAAIAKKMTSVWLSPKVPAASTPPNVNTAVSPSR